MNEIEASSVLRICCPLERLREVQTRTSIFYPFGVSIFRNMARLHCSMKEGTNKNNSSVLRHKIYPIYPNPTWSFLTCSEEQQRLFRTVVLVSRVVWSFFRSGNEAATVKRVPTEESTLLLQHKLHYLITQLSDWRRTLMDNPTSPSFKLEYVKGLERLLSRSLQHLISHL